jgi:predicted PurR-regulated permease PerM
MKAGKRKNEEAPPAERSRVPRALDSGETRSIMLAAAFLVISLYFIRLILLPFVLAAIIAYICTPLLDWAATRTRWPRLLFAVVLFVVLVGVSAVVVTFAAQRFGAELRSTATDLQGMLENFASQAIGDHPVRLLGQPLNAHDLAQSVVDRIRDWIGQSDQVVAFAGYSLVAIMGLFMTVVLLFYFLASGPRVARGLFWIVPPHRRSLVAQIWTHLDPVLFRYFLGVLAVVIYATIAAYIGLGVILGIHHAVLLALLTGILETVPVLGPTSAAVIAGLISLRTATGISSILAYAAYATLLRLSIDQIFGPIVLGRAAHVHPALIIFCFLAGGVVLGIPGVILAVPVALLIKSTLATLYGEEAA